MNPIRGKRPYTIFIVHESERPPVRLEIPFWAPRAVLLAALVAGAGLLVVIGMMRGTQSSAPDRTLDLAREQEMRQTIATQQEQLKGLSEQVEGFQKLATQADQLIDYFRQTLGWSDLGPTPTPTPTSNLPFDDRVSPSSRAITIDSTGHQSSPASSHEMALVVQARWNLARARDALPPKLALLETMQRRLQRWIKKAEQLDPGCSSDPQRLLADLKLLVVAPRGLPVSGVITDPFGWRLSTSGRNTGEKHTGVDIGGVMYFKLVRATQDGVVVWAGPMEKYGQAVEIQHEMGFSTLYAHNLSVLVRVGQKVRAGQALAYSGASGHATGPHVHYEVRLNDEPIDPMIFIDLDWPTTRGDRFVR